MRNHPADRAVRIAGARMWKSAPGSTAEWQAMQAPQTMADDCQHVLVLLDQCQEIGIQVRKHAQQRGVASASPTCCGNKASSGFTHAAGIDRPGDINQRRWHYSCSRTAARRQFQIRLCAANRQCRTATRNPNMPAAPANTTVRTTGSIPADAARAAMGARLVIAVMALIKIGMVMKLKAAPLVRGIPVQHQLLVRLHAGARAATAPSPPSSRRDCRYHRQCDPTGAAATRPPVDSMANRQSRYSAPGSWPFSAMCA